MDEGKGKVLGPLASKLVKDFHTGLEIQVGPYISQSLVIINLHRSFMTKCLLVQKWLLPRILALPRRRG